jgi:hypothetical protein
MPAVLAVQEAEIRRITVQSQPWANSSRDPISKKPFTKRAGRVAQAVVSVRPCVQTPVLPKRKLLKIMQK